jgi:polysaccharide deacetylase family protein (PEP-CTERM system associated)
MHNALTVDVEDWPQSTLDLDLPITQRFVRSTVRLLDILARRRVRATFFVLGKAAEAFPEIVPLIASAGHEVASHGYSHVPVWRLTPDAFAVDLRRAREIIEPLARAPLLGYRAPDFSIGARNLWALDVLRAEGLRYDSSIYPIRNPRYGVPGAPLAPYEVADGFLEFPLATVELGGTRWPVAGGGYLRLAPYRLTRWALQRINSEGRPGVVYLHPYELDPTELDELPYRIPLRLRVTQGLNRHQTAAKLDALLSDFAFAPMREVLGL